jgi:serine/threonine-protein kinase
LEEEEPRSQLPFILTAFGLLVTLGILFFIMWNSLGGGNDDPELVLIPPVAGLEQDAAITLLEGEGLEVRVVFENSDEVEQNVVIRTEPPAGEEVAVGTEVELFVSSGSQRIAVPPVVGLPLEAARQAIEAVNLSVGEVEERADPDFAEGIVIESDPVAGVEIGSANPVNLVVSSGPEEVEVPNLVEMTERDAILALTALDLVPTVDDEFSDDVPEDVVIRQDPEAGATAIVGDTVLIVVSMGPEPVQVPDLSDMTEGQAEDALSAVNLVLRVANSTQPVADESQDGRVVGQVPDPGTTVDQGDTVTVTLGEYTPPPTTTTTTTTTLPPSTTTTTEAP